MKGLIESVSKQTLVVVCATLAAAFLISHIPALKRMVQSASGDTGGIF